MWFLLVFPPQFTFLSSSRNSEYCSSSSFAFVEIRPTCRGGTVVQWSTLSLLRKMVQHTQNGAFECRPEVFGWHPVQTCLVQAYWTCLSVWSWEQPDWTYPCVKKCSPLIIIDSLTSNAAAVPSQRAPAKMFNQAQLLLVHKAITCTQGTERNSTSRLSWCQIPPHTITICCAFFSVSDKPSNSWIFYSNLAFWIVFQPKSLLLLLQWYTWP